MKKQDIPEQLPDILYVVTRERVRAGKPPMKIHPFEYVMNGVTGEKTMVMASAYHHTNGIHRKYPLENCCLTAEEAFKELQSIANREWLYQKSRLNHLKNNLSRAERLAKQELIE
jgi:hypothetical protein